MTTKTTSPLDREDPVSDGAPEPERDPFQSSWQQEFWYNESIREKRLNLLLHLAPYSAVLLVTGEEGCGKTTLLQQFLSRANDAWRICHLQGASDIDDQTLLDTIDKELSLHSDEHADPEERMQRLRDSLQSLRRGALVPLVVIDDAHLLSQSALTMIGRLTELRNGEEILLGVILCGEPSIEERFSLPGLDTLRERVSHSFDIPPLSEEGTAEYIRHRMRAAGLRPDGPFTTAVYRFIHVSSRGMPARINDLAREVLRNERQHLPDFGGLAHGGPSVGRLLLRYGAAALVISIVIVAFFYQDRISELVRVAAPPASTEQGRQPAVTEAPAGARLSGDAGMSGDAPRERIEDPKPVEPQPLADTPPGQRQTAETGVDTRPAPPVESAGEDSSAAAAPQRASPQETSPREAPQAAAAQPEPQPETQSADESAGSDGEPVMTASPLQTSGQEAPEPLTETAASAPSSPAQRGPAWLLEQPAGHFTLQLFASTEERARAFVEKNGLEERTAVFQATDGDSPLFSVTYGSYPTREAASRAAAGPEVEAIEGIDPWVRSFGAVHAAIRALAAAPDTP